MLVAEDLLLLLTDDDSGRLVLAGDQVDAALAGALLVELVLGERVDLTGAADAGRSGRVVVRDASPTGDPLLDEALARIGEREGRRPAAVIGPLGKGVRERLYQRLVAAGVLRAEHGTVLGVFPRRSWPTAAAEHERQLRRRLLDALAGVEGDDARVPALLSLLHALKAVAKVLDTAAVGLDGRGVRRRGEEVAAGSWASAAVRRALDEAMAAVVAATTAATAAATAGGS
ncbi:GPP34 family phosphoprotein [Quadrisphaera sp. DSM 44207]|uniref:GOLPH3/VPS74 family protein n=1 Tax=Quadrisphaera sp. DSM 44207 TaxID=1881057 RepID=UPI00088FFA8B|nr:GPP34 family phosphoprotein [Quadrisphaera sp. DSM 44207]SDQ87344.1 Golgi phosphoprotein 3 (GPP34) [Quadrisphaera sp. DSM 44207]